MRWEIPGGKSRVCFQCGRAGRSRIRSITALTVLLAFSVKSLNSQNALNGTNSRYLERCRVDCALQREGTACGKYRVLRWLHDAALQREFSYGPLRLIRIPAVVNYPLLPKIPRARAFKSGVADTLNFLRDTAEGLLTKRAIVYTIENPSGSRTFANGPVVLDEDELDDMQAQSGGEWRIFKKKKKSIILPLLILLNLFKLKLLLLPIFLGVHFIKKILLLGSFILPSILTHLKICKVPQPQQTYPHQVWATAAEAPVDYPSGFGHEESAWAHRNDYQGYVGYPAYHPYRNPYG